MRERLDGTQAFVLVTLTLMLVGTSLLLPSLDELFNMRIRMHPIGLVLVPFVGFGVFLIEVLKFVAAGWIGRAIFMELSEARPY